MTEPTTRERPTPERATFRLPWVSILFPVLLFYCATPLATWRPWLLWLYLVPLGALAYIVITRTQVDRYRIRTFRLFGTHSVPWDGLDRLEFRGTRWAVAVTTAGRRVELPMVRPRDMPLVAQVSGGWITLARPAAARDSDARSPHAGPPSAGVDPSAPAIGSPAFPTPDRG